MTRFTKIYQAEKMNKKQSAKTLKINSMNREGYGYIKRRLGLLSNEVKTPTYLTLTELSKLISKNSTKS